MIAGLLPSNNLYWFCSTLKLLIEAFDDVGNPIFELGEKLQGLLFKKGG